MNRIEKAFAQAREEKRAVFVGYLCAGDPDLIAQLKLVVL
jgi:tryptophan synthase alpha subunit